MASMLAVSGLLQAVDAAGLLLAAWVWYQLFTLSMAVSPQSPSKRTAWRACTALLEEDVAAVESALQRFASYWRKHFQASSNFGCEDVEGEGVTPSEDSPPEVSEERESPLDVAESLECHSQEARAESCAESPDGGSLNAGQLSTSSRVRETASSRSTDEVSSQEELGASESSAEVGSLPSPSSVADAPGPGAELPEERPEVAVEAAEPVEMGTSNANASRGEVLDSSQEDLADDADENADKQPEMRLQGALETAAQDESEGCSASMEPSHSRTKSEDEEILDPLKEAFTEAEAAHEEVPHCVAEQPEVVAEVTVAEPAQDSGSTESHESTAQSLEVLDLQGDLADVEVMVDEEPGLSEPPDVVETLDFRAVEDAEPLNSTQSEEVSDASQPDDGPGLPEPLDSSSASSASPHPSQAGDCDKSSGEASLEESQASSQSIEADALSDPPGVSCKSSQRSDASERHETVPRKMDRAAAVKDWRPSLRAAQAPRPSNSQLESGRRPGYSFYRGSFYKAHDGQRYG